MDGDDAELIAAAILSKDSSAFGELVRRYQSQVRLFLLRLCRDGSLADDLAQDCFVTAWQKLSSFRGTGSFGGWLMRIAWTTFLQQKRKHDRYREVIEQAASEGVLATTVQPDGEISDLDRLLAALNGQERAVMILAYGCGLSHREISIAAELPLGTVKSIIFRGKQKLRQDFDIEDHQYG
ncbi:MAG: sigma-70 family RNA polymerase sigma factor [Woeseia sp.]|nr:sigma-70 family RNA polymerase sigma factor [Woeseia sp.]NNE61869.1 sigma-70 family RNA polymerase sigma factor [Woeseia sp.]NNL55108.1 sigma-70 family RNA polymerase sigma factor [Woeseia sp.]